MGVKDRRLHPTPPTKMSPSDWYSDEDENPLSHVEVGKAKKDAIDKAYTRILRKLRKADKKAGIDEKFKFSLKQFRKIGASAIKRIGDADTARMFLGQKIAGVLNLYAQDDFAAVTQALKQWHLELKAAGILPTESSPEAKQEKIAA